MSTIDRIKTQPNGIIEVRILKSDGGWHRTTVEPGTDADEQMAAVNTHLVKMGQAQCVDYAAVTAKVAEVQTEKVVQDFMAAKVERALP